LKLELGFGRRRRRRDKRVIALTAQRKEQESYLPLRDIANTEKISERKKLLRIMSSHYRGCKPE